MGRQKTTKQEVKEPYIPRPDTEIYFYIPKKRFLLTPIPWKYKPNFKHLKQIIENYGTNIKNA